MVGAAEQREHRQVVLAVTTVRSRIDQHHPVGRPHHVAAPQVAVQPGRRIVVVEVARPAACRDGVDRGASRSIQARGGQLGHRSQPLVGVKLTPASVRPQRHRQGLRQRPEESGPVPSVGPGAERRCSRVVRDGQSTAELVCRLAVRSLTESSRRRVRLVASNDNNRRAAHTAVDIRKPSQPCGFTREEAGLARPRYV